MIRCLDTMILIYKKDHEALKLVILTCCFAIGPRELEVWQFALDVRPKTGISSLCFVQFVNNKKHRAFTGLISSNLRVISFDPLKLIVHFAAWESVPMMRESKIFHDYRTDTRCQVATYLSISYTSWDHISYGLGFLLPFIQKII